MDKESMQLMSLRLCRVIEDIGISWYVIMTRRKLWLMKEDMFSTPQAAIYHFGSQSEGTATKGMQDDVDLWICKNNIYVIPTWTEWQQGRHNYLLFKHEFFPPQHCWLQQLRYDSPEPVIKESTSHLYVSIGDKGMVVLSNSNKDCEHLQEFYRCELFPNGPTKYTAEDVDAVLAYKCSEQPTECQFLFKRSRPGHWPTPVLLQQARTCGVFLVPEGHPESSETMLEWRISTSLVERLLMFDLSVCQTKVYVLLKLIRKTYLQPLFGNRLSTFHLKTALLFTVESYPPDIWEDHRLVQCTIYCLQTLRRWLSMKYCPHFIIGGVDLFAGKLRKHEMQTVLDLMRLFVNDNLQCVFSMTTDRLGERMLRLSQLKSKVQPASNLVSNKAGMQIMFSGFQYVLVCCHFNAKLARPGERSENNKCHALLQETMEFYLEMTDKRNEQFGEALKFFQTTDKVSVVSRWFASMTKATEHAPLSRSSLPIHDMTSTRLKRAADLYCKVSDIQ
ncbi:uncharacterized protein LOC128226785 [Mya arenaria]|uniref:uncharacterized protein LOC128226785 n=1 Tax=Mya arenaria TaxID=6604 RepID=UPI0022E5388A|nr:uncharacterized protein LOC128226785 [Mya arenaria]